MDLNGDGILDLISGRYYPPLMTFFEGTGRGFKKGILIPEVGIDPSGKNAPVDLLHAAGFLADLNGDNLLDLLVGCNTGAVAVNLNQGTARMPRFGTRQPLTAGGAPVKVAARSTPTVADWDGDGTPDLLVGDNSAGVTFFKGAKADKGKLMTFAAGVPVIPGKPRAIVPGYRARPTVADWNGDGKLDLLVGNCENDPATKKLTGYVYLFLRR